MFDLVRELREIVAAFEAAGVEYALAGGLAVSIYATPRTTQDIDVLIAVAHLDAAIASLEPHGFRVAGRPMTVAGGRMEIQRLIKIEGPDILPLDLLLPRNEELAGILAARRAIDWQHTRLSIVTLQGLRRLKRLRGSAQDRADLEALGPESE